jgi:oligopeptide/dipeptide ABC transporter ATP-binding protein
MYLGRLVELARQGRAVRAPRHPYTRMLLDAIPDIHMSGRARTPVQGEVPNPLNPPTGCAFHPRCPHANARCSPSGRADGVPRRAGGLPRGAGRAPAGLKPRLSGVDQAFAARTANGTVSRSRIRCTRSPSSITSARAGGCCSCWPCHAVGTGRQHGQHMSPGCTASGGRGPASRPTRRPGRPRPSAAGVGALHAGLDGHPGLVHRRAHQVVHRRVDDAEVLGFAGLECTAPRSAARRHCPPASGRARAALRGGRGRARPGAASRRATSSPAARRLLVGVGDAQAAADVDVVEADASRLPPPRPGRAGGPARRGRVPIWVICEPMWQSMPTTSSPGSEAAWPVGGQRLVVGDAELVALQAGGDVGVGAGVDVGVDAQADRRAAAHARRPLRRQRQFGHALDVEAAHAGLQRLAHLGARLADAGEDHAAGPRRRPSRAFSSPPETMSKPQPACGKGLQHGQAGVGLHRVAHQVGAAGQGIAGRPVQRRAHRARE